MSSATVIPIDAARSITMPCKAVSDRLSILDNRLRAIHPVEEDSVAAKKMLEKRLSALVADLETAAVERFDCRLSLDQFGMKMLELDKRARKLQEDINVFQTGAA